MQRTRIAECTRPDGVALLSQIRRTRRRLVAIVLARALCVASGVVLVTIALSPYLMDTQTPTAGGWLAMAAAAAAASVAVSTWWRTPSLRETAAALDRRLALDDRVVAALALRDDPASISTLIVRDATRRLDGVSLKQVFPLRLGRAVWMIPAAAVVALPGIVPSPRPQPTPGGDGIGGQTVAVAAPHNAATDDRPRVRPGTVAASAESRARQTDRTTPTPGANTGDRRPANRTSPASAERQTAEGTTPAAPVNRTASSAGDAATSPPDLRRDRGSNQDATGPSSESNAMRPRRDRLEVGQKGGPETLFLGGSGRTRNADGSSAFGTESEPGTTQVRSGGIDGGAVQRDSREAERTDASAEAGYAARYEDARSRAESAVSRDDVPPRLRGYIRDYFLAIRPTAHP